MIKKIKFSPLIKNSEIMPTYSEKSTNHFHLRKIVSSSSNLLTNYFFHPFINTILDLIPCKIKLFSSFYVMIFLIFSETNRYLDCNAPASSISSFQGTMLARRWASTGPASGQRWSNVGPVPLASVSVNPLWRTVANNAGHESSL